MGGAEVRQLLWIAAKAFIVSLILTPLVRDIFRSYNVVDRPGRRKVHAHPIPRVGGIAIIAAYLFSLVSLSDLAGSLPEHNSPWWALMAGAGIMFLTGLLDDFWDLKPRYKLVGQVVASLVVFFNGLRVHTAAGYELPYWLSLFVTVAWILLATNALNLIDGLDGLCAGMGLLATLTMFGAAVLYGNVPLAHATFPLAGALLGFLCYNFNPATVFLGDSGALVIGFLLGCYGMIWTQKSATLLSITVPLLAISIPLLDVSLSIFRRFLRARPIFSADRGHIHHRLLDRGLSPRRAVLVLYAAAAIPAAVALAVSAPALGRYQAISLVIFFVAVAVGVRQLRYMEFNMAGQALFGGEFRRNLDTRLRLEAAALALNSAVDETVWWNSMVEVARDMKWSGVQWLHSGTVHRDYSENGNSAAWTFRAALSDMDTLAISGKAGAPSVDLIAFGNIAAKSFSVSRGRWKSVAQP